MRLPSTVAGLATRPADRHRPHGAILQQRLCARAAQAAQCRSLPIYVEIFRGTPMMVQAMVIYWGYAFASGGSTLPLIPSGILIVSINTGAYMAEIVRGGIISIDRGQFEGAMSIGMTHAQTMFKVIIPQVMRNILPSVSNEFVINIKDTSVLNVIGVTELYYFAGIIKRQNFADVPDVSCRLYAVLHPHVHRHAPAALGGAQTGRERQLYDLRLAERTVAAEIRIKTAREG
ncbi:MAG: amino acid ABC transporter permease [Oscillospiraceae bacterium]